MSEGRPLYGLAAEFDRPEALADAVETLRSLGFVQFDVYGPFPMADIARDLGVRTTAIPWIAFIAGVIGFVVQYGAQVWMNAIDYPLNVGGRPLDSWPAFIPAGLIVAVLWAGVATIVGLLWILRLPRLHHPAFDIPGFERASQDRFFLCLRAEDPRFSAGDGRRLMGELKALGVHEVRA